MRPPSHRLVVLMALCLAPLGCASSGRWDPYRARNIRPALAPARESGCRLAQASPPGRELVALPCPPGVNAQGRAPMPEDWKRLAEYDLTHQLLEAGRRDKIDQIAERVDDELAVYEQYAEELERRGNRGAELDRTRAFLADRKATFTDWIAKIDEALALAERERDNYVRAMADAARGERIVWHSSAIFTGWLPDRFASFQRGAEAEAAWRSGLQTSGRYLAMRAKGTSPSVALMALAGMVPIDLSGATSVIEALSGSEAFTGRGLSRPERFVKGVVGLVSVASLASLGGPRIGPFAQMVKGTRAALVELDTRFGKMAFPWLIVGEAGASLAITESEAFALAQAGLMQMSAVGAGGNRPPAAVPGLKGVYGKTRGGGSKAARAYQKKVTGRDDSVFVNGVEFDGWRVPDKTLLDAKLAKGRGSFYDTTGTDAFTERIKIPEIRAQARRQVAAMKGSGAQRIEWVVSDPFIAETLGQFLRGERFEIDVVLVVP